MSNTTITEHPDFAGFPRETVAAVVGFEAAARVSEIDHAHMEYGRHWQWKHGRQIITEAGLILLAEQLRARGFTKAADGLDAARVHAIQQLPSPTVAPAGAGAFAQEPAKNFMQKWEEAHE